MDRERFLLACEHILSASRERNSIGTLSEKSIHAVLKEYYEPSDINKEIKVGSFYADIVGKDGIIEIQSHQLFKLQKKLDIFLDYSPVTVVHPIACETVITWLDEKGKAIRTRKSPYKGNIYDAIFELYSIKYTLDNPNLRIIIPVIKVRDYRILSISKRRRSKYTKGDKIPFDIEEELILSCPNDYRVFIPNGLKSEFCSDDFARSARVSLECSRLCLNILNYLGLVEKIGKQGKKYIYKVNEADEISE